MAFLLSGTGAAQDGQIAPTPPSHRVSLQFVQPTQPPNYDHDVLKPLHLAQLQAQNACNAPGDVLRGYTCIQPPPPPPTPLTAPAPATAPLNTPQPISWAGLVGSLGFSLAGGNCVDEPGVNNPGYGDPINWPTTSHSPWIGASALFFYNHVAVVSGIYANGDIEVRQQNCPGCPHRYPASVIRGYR